MPVTYRLRMRNAAGGTWATLVKRVRAATGMTGAELARRLDVDRATIWRWEAGRQKPENAELIQAFADLFGLDLDEALAAAGLRPTTEPQRPPTPPMDPLVVRLLAMLADPDTPEPTKRQIRTMMEALVDMAEATPRPPKRRRGVS